MGMKRSAVIAGLALLALWFGVLASQRSLLVGQIGLQAFSAQQPGIRLVDAAENPDLLDPPLLTFALRLFHAVGVHPFAATKVIYAVASALAAFLFFTLVGRAMGKEAAAFSLAVWISLPLLNSVLVGSETHALLLLFLLLALRSAWRIAESTDTGWHDAALMGLWGGLAYLARFEGLLYFALLWCAAFAWRWKEHKRFPLAVLAAWPVFFSLLSFYLVVARMETGLWQGSQTTAHALLYAPIRLSLFQNELLSPEQVWGDGPRTFLGVFFHNPGMMAERIFVNFRNLLLMLGSLKGIPLYFWPLLGAGLFAAGIRYRGRETAFRGLLLLGLVPALAYLPFHWEERYLAPTGMFLLPWVGAGFAAVRRELAERWPERGITVAWGVWGTFAAMATVPFAVSMHNLAAYPVPPSVPHAYHHRADVRPHVLDAAQWMRDNAPKDALVVSPHILWAAHTGRALLPLAPADVLADGGEDRLRDAVRMRRAERRTLWLVVEEALLPPEARAQLYEPASPWRHEARFGKEGVVVVILRRPPSAPRLKARSDAGAPPLVENRGKDSL